MRFTSNLFVAVALSLAMGVQHALAQGGTCQPSLQFCTTDADCCNILGVLPQKCMTITASGITGCTGSVNVGVGPHAMLLSSTWHHADRRLLCAC